MPSRWACFLTCLGLGAALAVAAVGAATPPAVPPAGAARPTAPRGPVLSPELASRAHPFLPALCDTTRSVLARLAAAQGEPVSLLTYALFDAREWSLSAEMGAMVEDARTHD